MIIIYVAEAGYQLIKAALFHKNIKIARESNFGLYMAAL